MRRVSPLRKGDPEQLGRYRLLGRLGSGGQGVVYLGRDPAGQPVAVKTLHADFVEDQRASARFAKELAAARKVAPFCTAQVIDADPDPERPYIVSEFVDGPSLQQAVAEEGPRTGSALQRLAVATATALQAIHAANIVHRDFKPHNVLLGPDGPRVIDFGIARALDGTITVTNRPIGTPAYMSPEQIGGRHVGPASDVFAWGGVMVFAGTGRPPFGRESIPAIMNRVLDDSPDIEGFDGPLRDLVLACLAKEPAERPTTREIYDRLLQVPAGAPPARAHRANTGTNARMDAGADARMDAGMDAGMDAAMGPATNPAAEGAARRPPPPPRTVPRGRTVKFAAQSVTTHPTDGGQRGGKSQRKRSEWRPPADIPSPSPRPAPPERRRPRLRIGSSAWPLLGCTVLLVAGFLYGIPFLVHGASQLLDRLWIAIGR